MTAPTSAPAAAAGYVLWVPKWYPNPNDDQAGNFIEEHARALRAAGARLAVIFATFDAAPRAPLLRVEATTEHGFPVVRALYRQRLTGFAPLDRALKLLLYFVGLTRAYGVVQRQLGRPWLVHAHVLQRTALWARAYQWLTGIPYVVTEHWSIYRPQNAHRVSWLRRRLSTWLIGGAAGVSTVSAELAGAMQALGLRHPRYEVLPNVVDTALYHPPVAPLLRDRQHLLHVSYFNEAAKNVHGLLRTFARLRMQVPTAQLTVVGYGPAAESYYQLAAELDLTSAVTFTGKLDRPEVATLMRHATAFVLFSSFENLPCVLLEALASGLPVVATRVGGIPEIVEEGETGILVPPQDEAALLNALLALLTNRVRFAPAPALHLRAELRYSLPAVGARLRDWYAASRAAGRS